MWLVRVAVLVLVAVPSMAMAQRNTMDLHLFKKEPKAWVSPDRLFSIKVPDGWTVAVSPTPATYEIKPINPIDGRLFVRRIPVSRGASSKQLLMSAIDRRLRKLPKFKISNRRSLKIAGHKASAVLGTYYYQGNLQYPRTVEEIHVVIGEDAFIFYFECAGAVAHFFGEPLNFMYKSFMPRPPGVLDHPFAVPEGQGEVRVDSLPF